MVSPRGSPVGTSASSSEVDKASVHSIPSVIASDVAPNLPQITHGASEKSVACDIIVMHRPAA